MNAPTLIARRRAGRLLVGLAAVLLTVSLLLALLIARHYSAGPSAPHPTNPGPAVGGDWDLAAETALATRPMPALPFQASLPQPLAAPSGRPALRLPAPKDVTGPVPTGFPASPQGALAQVVALTERGLAGADPVVYATAYRQLALPGAAPADTTRMVWFTRSLRSDADLAPTGPIAGLNMTYQATHGLIKGVADGGRYAVVCVLGQFTADYQGRLVTNGTGDCQALRYVHTDGRAGEDTAGGGGQWRISPGAAAAPATDAWPGSEDSINVGYQELRR
jgi:hypothetical protein